MSLLNNLLDRGRNHLSSRRLLRVKDDIEALFVLSTGRTGTNTLERLFALQPTVDAHHEPLPRLFAERQRVYREQQLRADWIRPCLLKARSSLILATHDPGRHYVETSAFLSYFSPALHDLLPRAKFVFMVRHPADVIRSGMRRKWYESHPGDATRIVPRPGSKEAGQWDRWSRFQKICWYWAAYNDYCLTCFEELDEKRRMLLPAESLWSEGGETIAREVADLAGIPLPSEGVSEVLKTKFNSQQDSEFPMFADWDRSLKEQMFEIAGSVMEKFQYDTSA